MRTTRSLAIIVAGGGWMPARGEVFAGGVYPGVHAWGSLPRGCQVNLRESQDPMINYWSWIWW